MRSTSIFTCNIKPFNTRTCIRINNYTAHEIMSCGHNLNLPCRQIKSAISTAFHHTFELGTHMLWSQMGHRNKYTAIWRGITFAHFSIDRPTYHITRRALSTAVIIIHETPITTIQQMTTSAAQPFFQNGACHACMLARQKSCRVKLNHFHISDFKAKTQCHRKAIHRLIT